MATVCLEPKTAISTLANGTRDHALASVCLRARHIEKVLSLCGNASGRMTKPKALGLTTASKMDLKQKVNAAQKKACCLAGGIPKGCC